MLETTGHAPSCLRQELWNADTNELICRAEAYYGTGIEVFNEKVRRYLFIITR